MNTPNGTTTAALVKNEGCQAVDIENQLALSQTSLVLELMSNPNHPNHLRSFGRVLQARYGVSEVCATSVIVAALSGIIGPTHSITNPLGGVLPAAVNLIVRCPPNTAVRRAAKFALAGFQAKIDEKIHAHHEKGSKHRRQVRLELEQACAQALENLRCPPQKPHEPGTLPLPRDEQKKQALETAVENAEAAGTRLKAFEMQERPWLLSDGLTLRDIHALQASSFDHALLNFSPDGNALHLLAAKKSEKHEILRFSKAAWHGEAFTMGSETLPDPIATNLWLLGADQVHCALQEMQASGLPETFLLADAQDSSALLSPESFACTTQSETEWGGAMEKLWRQRVAGVRSLHALSEPALNLFVAFCNEAAKQCRSLPEGLQASVALWPEQLLKIAVILQAAGMPADEITIKVEILEEAICLMGQLGGEQLRIAEEVQPAAQGPLEAEIKLMVAKVRLYGPVKKRDVFRRFNNQSYARLEPILVECIERELIRADGNMLYPAQTVIQNPDEACPPAGSVSVSASVSA